MSYRNEIEEMKAILKESNAIGVAALWDRYLLTLGWVSPISLERVGMELKEAELALDDAEEELEIGDILQVLIRHCYRKRFDPRKALVKSLLKIMTRTEYCLEKYGVPRDEEHMNEMWAEAKLNVG